MNDLFTSHEEAREERAGIMADSGIEATADDLHKSSAARLVGVFFPEGKELGCFIDALEARSGKEYAEPIREYCREAWRREIETRKAQRANVDSGKVAK